MKKPPCLYVLIALIITATSYSAKAIDFSRAVLFDIPQEVIVRDLGRVPVSQLTYQDSVDMASYRFVGDTLRLLAILVEWSDRPSTYPSETIDSLLFSRGVYPGGSVLDYYEEVSYGQVTVIGEVSEWYNAGSYQNFNFWEFENILYDLDPVIDFSRYDGDHDGNADGVVFVRSGTGQEDSHDPNDIWSFALINPLGTGPGPFDGVHVPRWNTSPELVPLHDPVNPPGFTGVDTLNGIAVFAHELAHNLGLPDLYDYDSKLDQGTYTAPNDENDHPVVDWDIMGYGGYGLLSISLDIPTHFCGWSKVQMGWIDPITIEEPTSNIVLYDIETHVDNSLYLVPIDPSEGEYFLLEYRNPGSSALFDKLDSDFSCFLSFYLEFGRDSLDRGLLITHAHDSLVHTFSINNGTPTYPHYSVAIEDAGYNPSRNIYSNPEGTLTDSAQWWYPYETRKAATFSDRVPGQELFGPDTYPSSDGYGGPTGIIVRVDSIVDDRLYAYVEVPALSDDDSDGISNLYDNCPSQNNPDQFDADGDGIGDLCDNCTDTDNDGYGDPGFAANTCADDNCPSHINPEQADGDGDQVGDSCDNCVDVYNVDQADSDEDGMGDACESCCVGLTGNVDADTGDNVDLSDLTALIDYLFISFAEPECMAEANVDGDPSESVDLSDLTSLIDYLFISFAPPAPCQ